MTTSSKCAQCGAVNFTTDEQCRRCGVLLSVPARVAAFQYADEPKPRSLLRWILWIAGVAWLIVFIWSRSLVFTSEPLDQSKRWQVNDAIAVLKKAGFSREAFVLTNLTNYRQTDNWWNNYQGHENAYASTNFPLEIVTLYPQFFSEPVDDTERAAILLHEGHHLLGANEVDALDRTWREKARIGWNRDMYQDTKVFTTTEAVTFGVTDLFTCKDNHHWDCVPPVIYSPGETVVRR